MRRVYGLYSFLIQTWLYVMILGTMGYIALALYRRPFYHRTLFWGGAGSVLMALFYLTFVYLVVVIVWGIMRGYAFVRIENGVITFSPVHPNKPPVILALADITGITFYAGEERKRRKFAMGRGNEFIITTSDGEVAVPLSLSVPELRNLYDDLTTAGVPIQLAGRAAHLYNMNKRLLLVQVVFALALLAGIIVWAVYVVHLHHH